MNEPTIENQTFDEIDVGDSAQLERTLTERDVDLFAAVSGDINPTHVDEEYARKTCRGQVVGHSLWGGTLVSCLLGNLLPGPGTIYRRQDLRFSASVAVGDTLRVIITAREKEPREGLVTFDCRGVNQRDEIVFTGQAVVLAPVEKVVRPRSRLPDVLLHHHDVFAELAGRCRELPAMRAAVVHPCSEVALAGALEAASAGIIAPILVGPARRIAAVAREHGLDPGGLRVEDVQHSHAAAERSVELVRTGEADVLMKGSLHTDELLRAVIRRDIGLRTERRISHVFVMDVPGYPEPLLVTDAAVNIYPGLEEKRDICQNAIELAHALGNDEPRVAILSAIETVNPKIPSTVEAAALCKMADRGQISGAILEGPLALDNAISIEAALVKGIRSPVAGRADVLIAPNLEAGNLLAKNLTFLSHAEGAGVIVGARVPIILTSRADSARARLASCSVAALHAQYLDGARSRPTPGEGR